jgi:NhaP-type Na+/H+ or K+/H+ antiporter
VTPTSRRELVLIAVLAVVAVTVVSVALAQSSSGDFTTGLLVGIPLGLALGWGLDLILRWLVDRQNARRRGRR